ncbi:MAG: 30S ribosomal protein S20 [Clostridiales bacterium]|nr:30S ribosomal protein S20 [Clostridiales bacterium]
MPNIKSAKKRVEVIKTKTLQNSMIKSQYKTAIKKLDVAIEKNDNVEDAFKKAVKSVDQACAKGVLKKNTASRKKSQLSKKVANVK